MSLKIKDILDINSIEIKLKLKNKEELLIKLVELANNSGKLSNFEKAKKEVFDREKVMSTGVGKGIALPHAKTNAVTNSIGAFVTLQEAIDFDSIDNIPVNIVFLLLGRENDVNSHLKLLSNVSRLMNSDSFRMRLLDAKDNNEVIEIFTNTENL